MKIVSESETIVALSTPYGESGIAVIRLSGPACFGLAKRIFGRTEVVPRYAYYGNYTDTQDALLDSVIYIYFGKGHSYTGEEMLEISTHGNVLIIQKVVEDLVKRGCRHAEPGEFTRRAFLNGKLDLCQSEAVADLIHAKSEKALQIAHRQLHGEFSERLQKFIDGLIEGIAIMEAYLDFPEDDLPAEDAFRVVEHLKFILNEIELLLASHQQMPTLTNGIRTIIVGPPNAGKSTLLNALLGQERALVSPIPGTTRDFISEFIHVGPYGLRLVDTAGVHDTSDEIERRGIEKTLQQLGLADIVLLVLDRSLPFMGLPPWVQESLKPTNTLVLINKVDLPCVATNLLNIFKGFQFFELSLKDASFLPVLKDVLVQFLHKRFKGFSDVSFMVHDRHAEALKTARENLNSALLALQNNHYADVIASELKNSLYALEKIIGRVDYERVLDDIFSRFCIGK